MKDTQVSEEDELTICSKKSNKLSNNHFETDEKKYKYQNLDLKSLKEQNPKSHHLCVN